MTKRKAARKRPAAKQAKKAARKAVRRPAAAKAAASRKKKPVKKKAAAVRKPAKKKAAARKSVKKKAASRARPAPKKKAAARARPAAKKKAAARRPAAKKKAAIRRPAVKKTAPKKAAARKAAKPSRLADQAETQSRVEEMLREGPPEAKAYMSAGQKKWFRSLLEEMLSEIRSEAERTNQELLMQEKDLADELDRAHSEYRFVVDLRENERISQLQVKISHSLRMLESGDYGICEDCGVQIGIKRMASRPMATKCIDCKNFQEDLEKNAL